MIVISLDVGDTVHCVPFCAQNRILKYGDTGWGTDKLHKLVEQGKKSKIGPARAARKRRKL